MKPYANRIPLWPVLLTSRALSLAAAQPSRASRRRARSPRAACEGSTGPSFQDRMQSFLQGEAARADEIRAGLVACYQVIDGLQ